MRRARRHTLAGANPARQLSLQPVPLGIGVRERPTPRLLVARRPVRPLRILHRDPHSPRTTPPRTPRAAPPTAHPAPRFPPRGQAPSATGPASSSRASSAPTPETPSPPPAASCATTTLAWRAASAVQCPAHDTRTGPRIRGDHRHHRSLPAALVQRAMHTYHTRRTYTSRGCAAPGGTAAPRSQRTAGPRPDAPASLPPPHARPAPSWVNLSVSSQA